MTLQPSVVMATCRKTCFPQIVLIQYKGKNIFWLSQSRAKVTNVVPAGTRSPARTKQVAREHRRSQGVMALQISSISCRFFALRGVVPNKILLLALKSKYLAQKNSALLLAGLF